MKLHDCLPSSLHLSMLIQLKCVVSCTTWIRRGSPSGKMFSAAEVKKRRIRFQLTGFCLSSNYLLTLFKDIVGHSVRLKQVTSNICSRNSIHISSWSTEELYWFYTKKMLIARLQGMESETHKFTVEIIYNRLAACNSLQAMPSVCLSSCKAPTLGKHSDSFSCVMK